MPFSSAQDLTGEAFALKSFLKYYDEVLALADAAAQAALDFCTGYGARVLPFNRWKANQDCASRSHVLCVARILEAFLACVWVCACHHWNHVGYAFIEQGAMEVYLLGCGVLKLSPYSSVKC